MSEIAREAGALLMHYFHQHLKIEYKGDADLVTAADRASEKLIRERILSQWPGHDVLGEEQGLSDQGSDYRWYVDPLDGTTNFAHGYPVFCVSLGLEYRGLEDQAPGQRSSGERASRVAAAIYDPTRDELFTAEQGRGAQLNGESIHVSKTATLKESLLATGFPATSGTRIRIFTFITRSRCTRMACAGQGRRRSICATWLADATTDSGSSISIRGTRPQAC